MSQGPGRTAAAWTPQEAGALGRGRYEAPRIVHEAELETRAGTALGPIGGNAFDPITETMTNPWDPDYTAGPGQ